MASSGIRTYKGVLSRSSRFAETQILAILAQADALCRVKDLCRGRCISQPTDCDWCKHLPADPEHFREITW